MVSVSTTTSTAGNWDWVGGSGGSGGNSPEWQFYPITTSGTETTEFVKVDQIKKGRYWELASKNRWMGPSDNEDKISDFPTDLSRLVDILETRLKAAVPLNSCPTDLEEKFHNLKTKLFDAEQCLDRFIDEVSTYFLMLQKLEE